MSEHENQSPSTETGGSGRLTRPAPVPKPGDSGSLGGSSGSGISNLSGSSKEKPKRDERDLGPLFFILVLCIFLPVAIKFYGSYMEKRVEHIRKLEEEKALTNEIKRLEKKNNDMKSREQYLHTEHGVEEIARNKLGLIKPKEIPFIVKPAGGSSGRNVVISEKNKKENMPDEKKKEGQEKNSSQ